MVYEILLNTDINDIQELCHINKQNTRLCESNTFWHNKFVHDRLPPVYLDDTRTIKAYSDIIGTTPRSIDTWIELYSSMKDAYKNAKFILLINKIEKFRYNYQTTGIEDPPLAGIIKITGPSYYGEGFELYHFLSKEVIKDLLKQATLINQDDPFVYIESIK